MRLSKVEVTNFRTNDKYNNKVRASQKGCKNGLTFYFYFFLKLQAKAIYCSNPDYTVETTAIR